MVCTRRSMLLLLLLLLLNVIIDGSCWQSAGVVLSRSPILFTHSHTFSFLSLLLPWLSSVFYSWKPQIIRWQQWMDGYIACEARKLVGTFFFFCYFITILRIKYRFTYDNDFVNNTQQDNNPSTYATLSLQSSHRIMCVSLCDLVCMFMC